MMYNLQTYQSKKWQSLQLLLSARQLCPIWVNDSNNDITMFQFKTFVCMCSTVENTFSSYSYFLKNIDGLKQLSKDLNAEEGVTLIDNWKLIHLRLGCSIPTLFYYFESSMLNVFNQHSLFDNKNMWIEGNRSPSSIIWIAWFLRKLLDVILNFMDYNTLWIKHQCSRSKWGYCENKNSKTLTLCKLCSLHVKISKFDILILWFETYSSYERYVIPYLWSCLLLIV